MRNLLSAGFVRLWRCKMLWLSSLFLAGITVTAIWTRYSEGLKYGFRSSLDSAFAYYAAFIAFLIPVVCTMFIGVEYSDGTIRNKMICGHRKDSVYLSNLIPCCVGSLIMCTAAVVPGLCVGLPLLGSFEMGRTRIALFFIAVYALALAWTSLFTLLTMLFGSRTVSSVAALQLLLSLTLLAAGTHLSNRLDAEPTIRSYSLNMDGEIVAAEEAPNPAYLPDGPVRDVFRFLYDFTPSGQTIQLVELAAKHPVKLAGYDAVFFFLTTGAGLALFRRKDLK